MQKAKQEDNPANFNAAAESGAMSVIIVSLNQPQSDIQYTDALVALNEKTLQANAAPYLYPQGRDFYHSNLAGATFNFLAMAQQQVVGYSALRPMSPWPDYLDPPTLPIELCALMLYTLVDPDWRGQGIGRKLNQARLEQARKLGFRYLYSTVHPDNTPNMKNLMRLGFEMIAQKLMFENPVLRNLMFLDLMAYAESTPAAGDDSAAM